LLLSVLSLLACGEGVQEAVGEKQHQHRKQRRDRQVHGEVGALGGLLEVAVLLSAQACRLVCQELGVRAFFAGQQFGEAEQMRLLAFLGDVQERASFVVAA
jgi:hypothetical protein